MTKQTPGGFDEQSVMIIEDDLILTLSLELILKKMGFKQFLRAADGEEALELIEESRPDLILVDICLGPGITGVEAVQKIHSQRKIPVIYITGNSDSYHRENADLTDHVDYLVKPITPGDVRRSIEKIWPRTVTR